MNAKIAVVLSLIACVINCVGLAIPYWLVASKDEAGLSISVNSGIWLVCYHGVIYGLQVDKCNSYDDPKILTVPNNILQVRYIEITASILMFASTIWGFNPPNANTKPPGVICIIAGILALVGCILFATNSDIKTLVTAGGTDYHEHAGFALCIIAGVFSLVSGVLYMIVKNDTP